MTEKALCLLAALGIDFFLGDRESWPHPVRWMGKGYEWLENFFRRLGFLDYGSGIMTLSLVVFFSAWVPFLALFWLKAGPIRWVLESFLFYLCLSVKGLADEARIVEKSLRGGKLAGARNRLARIVGRDTQKLSPPEIARAVVETVGESFVDGFFSPVFWGLLGGVPGAFFFKAVSTGDSMIGHPEPPYEKFGWAAAKLDDGLNFIPARLVPLVLAPAAFFLGLSVKGLLRIFFQDRLRHASPNAAHGEAAFAGALGVRLGGMNFYDGKPYRQAFLNPKGRSCGREDIRRAVGLLWGAAACTGILLLFAAWGARP